LRAVFITRLRIAGVLAVQALGDRGDRRRALGRGELVGKRAEGGLGRRRAAVPVLERGERARQVVVDLRILDTDRQQRADRPDEGHQHHQRERQDQGAEEQVAAALGAAQALLQRRAVALGGQRHGSGGVDGSGSWARLLGQI
jgi:hypothetical protein